MTSLRLTRTLKSAVAVIVSGSLFVTTAVMPVAAQTFRAGQSAEAGASSRAGFTPSIPNGVQPLPVVPALLVPALSPVAAPSALGFAMPAAAKESERPATPAAAASPAKKSAPADAGPRWVKKEVHPAPEAGPRWVGSKKTGLRAVLEKLRTFLGRSGSETFDGSAARGGGEALAPIAARTALFRSVGLSRPALRVAAIVNDRAIPTPEAARRVGEIRRSLVLPLWAKVVAPLSVAAAVAVAIHFGAVPVLTLAVGLVVSVLAHEISHIAVLHRLGDRTAEHAGSHSLNPLAHIDAVKTVIVPALSLALSSFLLPFPILLGAGKPVDADFNNLHSPFGGPRSARNAFWVAAAGPATNLLIAGLAFAAAALLPAGGVLAVVALGLAKMNLALSAFNMLPLPQLDGGKILASVFPEGAYTKWVFNPRVQRGYQSVFRRLYEGPSNILTWLADSMGVRTQKGVNRLANTVTFTALAAFYAAAYFSFGLGLPLLFLALPCSYDYWCIHEKVRSEAAVSDLMELMSQWSAVIVQISEDLGLQSEVSAFETEHAMKNALESLVDEMTAKEEFRALSAEQKLEALMKEYPDKAAEHLKKTAMPEDSLEKIKAVLADPRNGPFYERLRKWFTEHEIFARWDNQHQRGKLKDAIEEAEKLQERGAGGSGGAVISALAALGLGAGMGLFPDWAPHAAAAFGGLGVFGMFGVLTGSGAAAPQDSRAKVTVDPEMSPAIISVMLVENANEEDVQRVFAGLRFTRWMSGFHVLPDNIVEVHLLAFRIAQDPAVARIVVGPEMRVPPNPLAKVTAAAEVSPQDVILVKLVENANQSDVERVFRDLGYVQPRQGQPAYQVTLVGQRADAIEIVRRVAGDVAVAHIVAPPELYVSLMAAPRSGGSVAENEPASEDAEPEVTPAPDPMAKVRADAGIARDVIDVTFIEDANWHDVQRIFAGLNYNHTEPSTASNTYRVTLGGRGDSTRLVESFARDIAVAVVTVHPELYTATVSPPVRIFQDDHAVPRGASWIEKIRSDGFISQARVRAVFASQLDALRNSSRLPSPRELHGDSVETTSNTPLEAAELARSLAERSDVVSVMVSALVRSLLPTSGDAAQEPRTPVSQGTPAVQDPMAKVRRDLELSPGLAVVTFAANANNDDNVRRIFDGLQHIHGVPSEVYTVTLDNPANANLIARRIARDAAVESVVVSSELYAAMALPVPVPVGSPRASVRWESKLVRAAVRRDEIRIVFNPVLDVARIRERLSRYSFSSRHAAELGWAVTARTTDEAAEIARTFAGDADVERVTISPDVHARLTGTTSTPRAEERAAPAPQAAPAPRAAADPNGWAKIGLITVSSEWNIGVIFDPSVDAEAVAAILADYRLRGFGPQLQVSSHEWKMSFFDMSRARELVRELAGDVRIRYVFVSPAVHDRLMGAVPAETVSESAPAPSVQPALPAKIVIHEGRIEHNTKTIRVKFIEGTAEADIHALLARHGLDVVLYSSHMQTLSAASAEQALEKAVALAAEASVEAVHIYRTAAAVVPVQQALPAKIASYSEVGHSDVKVLRVKFSAATSEADIHALVARHGLDVVAYSSYMQTLIAASAEQAREKALALAAEASVEAVHVHLAVAAMMTGQAPVRQAEPAPVPPADPNWAAKIVREEGMEGKIHVFDSSDDAEAFGAILAGYGAHENISAHAWKISVSDVRRAAEIAREIAGRMDVRSVGVAADVKRILLPPPTLPAKVTNHGKAEYGANVVLARFLSGTDEADIRAALSRHGQGTLYRQNDMYTVSAKSAEEARSTAVALAAEASVAAVKVHPNVATAMIEDAPPYPNAPSYDHVRAILVEFREDMSAEAIKDYAEVRRLRLVHPNFRGSERTALFEVPEGAGVRATLEMLADETAAPHSAAESVRPFQEQPGEPELSRRAPPAAVEESRPEVAAARRDPAQAWLEYLQNVTLSDGKSKLTDPQIQKLTVLLKPLAHQPDAPRPPIVSRNDEVKRMLPIVTSPRGMRNSVILVGEAGVGKTAVAEGLAEMIEDAEAAVAADSQAFLQFERLKGRWLVELDINKVLTDEDPVGLLSAILDLLPRFNTGGPSRGNDIIVLMDEIQKFFLDKAGQKIANTLKGPLRDGKISVIATTTSAEYKKFIETDDAFRRRFEKIDVAEPTVPQTIAILRAMKAWLQSLHDAVIPDEALVSAAKLADQFDKTNFNPDKAIKAVQDAAELSRPDNLRAAVTLDLRETWGEVVLAVNEARQALVDKGIASILALPVDLYNKIAALVAKAEALYAEREAVAEGKGQVTTDVVKRVIAAKTGIASGQLNLGEDDASRYTKMEEEIGRRVINQDPALTAIANAVRRNKAGLSNPNRPMGKFLLTGPTGVGKTYLAKELARFLFKDPNAMIRLDMSEYMEEHTVQRMTGAPPSYVGYEAGGQLTEAVRKKPYSVLLFDEIEKAHPKVFDVLLQILDDGRLTDGQGRTVDFKNTVIIMTSNGGMSGVDGEKYAKLLAKAENHNKIAEINKLWDEEIDLMVGASIKERFRPEFLNRLDEDPLSKNKWIRVNRLRPEDIAKIASIQLKEFAQLLIDRHDTEIQFDPSVVDFLAVEGYSPLYGARPMTAAIEKHIIDPLAQWILKEAEAGKKDVRGALIKVVYAEGKIAFAASPKPEKNTARATVQGASEAVAAELFALIERLSGDGTGEEPSENLFDKIMRKARPMTGKSSAGTADDAAASRTKAFFAPGMGLAVNGPTSNVDHNNAQKKDAAARFFAKGLIGAVPLLGWPADVLEALNGPVSGPGEGWIKLIIKLAKEQATKAGATSPVTVASYANKNVIQIAIGGAYTLSEDDQRVLEMHFSGAPAASYLEAQKKANGLNLSARLLWDHNLLDVYRRLAAIPGARMGFKTGPEGTQIWIEIKREAPAPAAEPKAVAAKSGDRPAATPHQVREMAKTRELLMTVIDQSRLQSHERDGHAIRIAAAEGYALLASPADLAAAREWIKAKGWVGDVEATMTWGGMIANAKATVGADWPLAMTAALILERFGGAEDVEMLENVARRVTDTTHYEVPVHGALVSALSAIYTRLGLAATRSALIRALSMQTGRSTDITDAAKRALGAVGMPVDIDSAQSDADGYLAMMRRLGREEELSRIFRDTALWGENSAEPVRQAALKLAGETETGDVALNRLKNMMKTQTSYSRTGYEMSRAWAAIVAREGLTRGLGDAMKRYLDACGVGNSSRDSSWPILYAYVAAAALAGGADTLGALEGLMNQSPGDVAPKNEQSYFSAPDAWARALIRSGKFEEYSRSQGLNTDGSPKPSKLQDMLTNRMRPMFAAAALRAIAYARNPSFSRRGAEPKGDLPDILPDDVPRS